MNIVVKQSNKQVLDLQILKDHLRIDHSHEDLYLNEIISMATDILEKNIEKPILKKTYKYIYYNDSFSSTKRIYLPLSHVRSVISVKKLISERDSEKIKFSVDSIRDKTAITINGCKYPVEIVYTAGITDKVDEIPKDLQFAILHIAKNIYECSEEDVLESKYIKHIINANRTLHID